MNQADPPFHALIDTGALITGLSNKGVAEYLLKMGLPGMKGVVFLDELDRQMVLLRNMKVVKLAESGLKWGERFTFYGKFYFLIRFSNVNFYFIYRSGNEAIQLATFDRFICTREINRLNENNFLVFLVFLRCTPLEWTSSKLSMRVQR